MNLKEKINENLKKAMLAKDEARVTTLRGLKSAILDVEVATNMREQGLPDDEIEKIVARELKKRKESYEIYTNNGRNDLADAEKYEIEVLNEYLPKQLSEDELREKIEEIVAGLDDGIPINMGMLIGKVKNSVGSAADGAMIAKLVKEKIG